MKKKLFFPILLFLMANLTFAQSSIITIFHQDGEKFWVIIDGVKQNEKPSASITLPNITTDFLRVKILFENPAIASIDQNLQTRDVDNHYTHCKYIIKPAKKGKHVMRINSYEPLTGSVQSNSNVIVDDKSTTQSSSSNVTTNTQQSNPTNVNPNTQVQTNTQSGGVNMNTNMSQSGNANQQGVQTGVSIQGVDPATGEKIDVGMNINMNVGENGVQTGVNVKDGGNNGQNASVNSNMSFSQTSTSTTTTTNVNGGHSSNLTKPNTNQNNANPTVIEKNNQTRPANADACYSAMAPDAFAAAKNSISSKSFEDTKLTTAKQVAGSNCLSSNQVKEIMSLFSFEDSKLTFAKFAYNRVVDKNNYFMVNDAFTFSSSVDELNDFIQGK